MWSVYGVEVCESWSGAMLSLEVQDQNFTKQNNKKTGQQDGWARFACIKGLDEYTFTLDSRVPRRSVIYPRILLNNII